MNTFIQLLINAIVEVITPVTGSLASSICQMIMDEDFSPSLSTFYNNLGAINIVKMLGYSKYGGYLIIIVIFNLSLISFLYGVVRENKDKLYALALRCVFALITINLLVRPNANAAIDEGFIGSIIAVGENAFARAEYTLGTNGVDSESGLTSEEKTWINNNTVVKDNANTMWSSLTAKNPLEDLDFTFVDQYNPAAWIASIIKGIMKIGLTVALTMGIIELAYDMVRRYANFCGLYLCSPAASGLIAGYSTIDIFFKFMIMLVCEIGMMSFCRLWLASSIFLMQHIPITIPSIVFTIAWTTFGRQIDNVLNKMGLSTASMGGALVATSVGIGAGALGAGALIGSKGFGMAGAFTGNDILTTIGQGLAKNSKGAGSVASMQQEDASPISKMGRAYRQRKDPTSSGLSKDQMRRMMGDLQSPNMRNMGHFEEMYRGLNEQGKAAFNNELTANNSQLKNKLGKDLGFSVVDADKDGIMFDLYDKANSNEKIGEGNITNIKDDKANRSVPFVDNDGHNKWANFYTDRNAQPKTGDSDTFKSEDIKTNLENERPFATSDEARCGYDLKDITDFDPSKGDVTRLKTDAGYQFFQGDGTNRKMIGEQINGKMHSRGSLFSDNGFLNDDQKAMNLTEKDKNQIRAELFDNQFYKKNEINGFGHVVMEDGVYAGKFGGKKPIASHISFEGDSIKAIIADRKYATKSASELTDIMENPENTSEKADLTRAFEQKMTWHTFDSDNPSIQHKYSRDNDLLGSVFVTAEKPRNF